MNIRDYFLTHFPAHADMLDVNAGAGDSTSDGEVMTEMDIDSPCGLDCKMAVDAAVQMCNAIAKAYGRPGDEHTHPLTYELTPQILNAAIECCVCYIRG